MKIFTLIITATVGIMASTVAVLMYDIYNTEYQ